jgi:carbamoyl-phosphate synthase large subunit
MGVGRSFGEAFGNASLGAGTVLPHGGTAFISVRNADKSRLAAVCGELVRQGFKLIATGGTAESLRESGLECQTVNKVSEGRPHIVDMIKNDEIDLIVNTSEGRKAVEDSYTIRREALNHKVAYTTTLGGARALSMALDAEDEAGVERLQELHKELG